QVPLGQPKLLVDDTEPPACTVTATSAVPVPPSCAATLPSSGPAETDSDAPCCGPAAFGVKVTSISHCCCEPSVLPAQPFSRVKLAVSERLTTSVPVSESPVLVTVKAVAAPAPPTATGSKIFDPGDSVRRPTPSADPLSWALALPPWSAPTVKVA